MEAESRSLKQVVSDALTLEFPPECSDSTRDDLDSLNGYKGDIHDRHAPSSLDGKQDETAVQILALMKALQ